MINSVYKQLLEAIANGKQAVLVSKYNGKITKTLLFEEAEAMRENSETSEDPLTLTTSGGVLTLTEYYAPKPRLIILGGGHIALPLCYYGASLGFQVTVFDDRPSFANNARFPSAASVICDAFENFTKRIAIRKNDYVVIVTRGHRHDSICLRAILDVEFPCYVGMIGSRRRVAIVKKQLEEDTGEIQKLSLLHAPIGLPIGAVTPGEIAICIVAEIIKVMRLGDPAAGGFGLGNRVFMDCDEELLDWLAQNDETAAALVTVLKTDGSTPREAGAKMAILSDGRTIGSIGGGCAESDVAVKARDILRKGGYCVLDIDLTDSAKEDGMVCGGTMSVLIEALR
jgi:xanthine dehydrogenase accessory factor